jgi:hypothetical protein
MCRIANRHGAFGLSADSRHGYKLWLPEQAAAGIIIKSWHVLCFLKERVRLSYNALSPGEHLKFEKGDDHGGISQKAKQ